MTQLIKTDGDFNVMYARPFSGSEKLKHFPIPWKGVSTPQIPTFRGRPAPLANNYLRWFDNRRRRRLRIYDNESLAVVEKEYVDALLRLEGVFGPLLSSYDDDVVLKTTCALGLVRPAHFDMDEKGVFGTGRSYQYDEAIISCLERDLIASSQLADGVISMKRGTNLGWPTPKGGRSRDESDVLLALHVASVQGGRCRSMTLSTLLQTLQSWYGPAFAIAGERFQTTERVIPIFYSGGVSVYHNFAQRVRGIYFSPKFMVAWNRRLVKTILSGIMSHPMHIQDRSALKTKINKMNAPDNWCFSLDVSRFDQSHGIAVVEPLLKMMSRVGEVKGLGSADSIFSDLKVEFCVDDVVPTSRDLLWEAGGQILSSGLSMTSIVGCCSSHCIAYELAKFLSRCSVSDVDKGLGHWWDALTWGDDVVFSIQKERVAKSHGVVDEETLLAAVTASGSSIDLKFSFEPTIKFLGQNYDMRNYKDASTGYPVGRFIQQQFFPERQKTYPFNVIGYIARLSLLDASIANDVHKAMSRMWPFDYPYFKFEDVRTTLAKLLPEVEKYSQSISQLDDVLGVFTHGLDPSDIDTSDYSEFADLLAIGSVDVTDPSEFLTSQHVNISRDLLSCVEKVQKGDLTQFHRAVEQIATTYRSTVPVSGQLYY